MKSLPKPWRAILQPELESEYYRELSIFVEEERKRHLVYPPEEEVFSALELTPFHEVGVFILGQDPYPSAHQAHGLAFSVKPGIKAPRSLVNIFREIRDDLGHPIPNNGCLIPWAERGVLLLNAVLTVRAGEPNSHKNRGWEKFTDAIIQKIGEGNEPIVFLLWGAYAQKKKALIDSRKHCVIECAHPSPLSARNGFFGSRCFSRANSALKKFGRKDIDWKIPDI